MSSARRGLRVVPEPAEVPRDPEIEDFSDEDVRHLGATIRELRQNRAMTLADLANRSTLSIGLLSRLENGGGNPSLLTLTKLAAALDVPVVSLFRRPAPSAVTKVSVDERIAVTLGPGVRHELLLPTLNGRFLVSLLDLSADARSLCPAARHAGVEFIFVRRGRVDLHVDDELYRLEAGDSATYDASRSHRIDRAGGGVAKLLYATAPAHLP